MMHLKREKKESKTIGNESNKALLSDNFSATLQSYRRARRYEFGVRVMKLVLMFFSVFIISGCADYKTGYYWEPGGANWKSYNKGVHYAGTEAYIQCNDNQLKLQLFRTEGGQIIAPFFIPIFKITEATENDVYLHLTYPNAKKICQEVEKENFNIKINGKSSKNYSIKPGFRIDECTLHIETEDGVRDSISLDIEEEVFGCDVGDIFFQEKKYFCIKPTELGGSKHCVK